MGRFPTREPLGPIVAGPNLYTYVRNNPLTYADPSGLILMAFDGTNNDPMPNSTNVWWFWKKTAV